MLSLSLLSKLFPLLYAKKIEQDFFHILTLLVSGSKCQQKSKYWFTVTQLERENRRKLREHVL